MDEQIVIEADCGDREEFAKDIREDEVVTWAIDEISFVQFIDNTSDEGDEARREVIRIIREAVTRARE